MLMSRQRLAAAGGVLVLIPALGLVAWLIQVQDPLVGWGLGSLYVAPYVAVLVVARWPSQGTTAGLPLALGLTSLVASLSPLTSVGLVLLPATAIILFASARDMWRLKGQRIRAGVFFPVGLSACAAVAAGGLAVLIALDSRRTIPV